jgi:predicted nucleic acid-binding protein
MTSLVVDASVAAKWFLPEADAAAALRLLNGRHRLAAPDLIRAEVGNVVWKLHGRDVLSAAEASEIIEDFLAMPLEIHDSGFLVASALEIAMATRRTVYDSLYLALAIELDATVITADEHCLNALKAGPFARFVRPLGRRRS